MTGAERPIGTALVETEPLFCRPPFRRQSIKKEILAPGKEGKMVRPIVVSRVKKAHHRAHFTVVRAMDTAAAQGNYATLKPRREYQSVRAR